MRWFTSKEVSFHFVGTWNNKDHVIVSDNLYRRDLPVFWVVVDEKRPSNRPLVLLDELMELR